MQTNVRNPLEIFSMPQLLEVPVFQRRYVWGEEAQWEPLWQDIARVAEAHLAGASSGAHFLGAVVTQSSPTAMGSQPTHAIIDGQQRLTTLQLVLDATAAVIQNAGLDGLAQQLTFMTHNPAGAYGAGSLKLHHENDDGAAFHAVMLAEPPIDYQSLPAGRIVDAHRYFAQRAAEFMGDPVDSARAQALVDTLAQGLNLVVISLNPEEPAQEIFETLNARGTPLTAADLIKNFVFQQVKVAGGNTADEYRRHWLPLESKYWETEVSVGRYSTPRLALFLNYWVVAHTAEEVSPRATFTRFKAWFQGQHRPMADVLASLHAQAELYRKWEEESSVPDGDLAPELMFLYRARALGVEAIKPLLLWLYDVDRKLPAQTARVALQDVESWLMRRALLGLTTANYTNLVVGMLVEMSRASQGDVPERLRSYLTAQNRPSTYWPGDADVRRGLATSEIYYQPRARVRAYLEAVEDYLRGYRTGASGSTFSGSRVHRGNFTIEHLMPQGWRAHWPTAPDADSIVKRDMHVQRLGNLTLLTQSLNSSVSNSGWLEGKRDGLASSDTLLLTRGPRSLARWDEVAIDEHGSKMAETLLQTWPVPPGHEPVAQRKVHEESKAFPDLRALVEENLVAVGTPLLPGWGDVSVRARVLADGRVEVGGEIYGSPSGAASAVLGGATVNGWQFWRTEDGRELRQLRP